MGPLQRLKSVYRERGLRGTLAKATRALTNRLRDAVYLRHEDLVLARDLAHVKTAPTKRLHIEPIGAHHAAPLRRFSEEHCDARTSRKLRNYIRNGYRGFLALRGDTIIGYLWWVDGRVAPKKTHPHLLRYGLDLHHDDAYGFDYFVAPLHRVGGSAVEFIALVQGELTRLGYQQYWGAVAAENERARWVYDVTGFRVVKRVTGHEVFSWLLFVNGRIFLKNRRWNANVFDYRPLPWRKTA